MKKKQQETKDARKIIIGIVLFAVFIGVAGYLINVNYIQGEVQSAYNQGVVDGRLSLVDYTSRTGNVFFYNNGTISEESINTLCNNLNNIGGQ